MCKNILVADDDKGLHILYSRLFSGQDYAITLADSFAEASGLIKNNDYDLLITDLIFPDGLGTELIRLFKNKCSAAKSLLVTGSPEIHMASACAGTSGYVEKPFAVKNFMNAVAKVLSA